MSNTEAPVTTDPLINRRPSRHQPPLNHEAPQSLDTVEQFRKIEDLLSNARGKTLSHTLFADIISGLSNVKSAVIDCLSRTPHECPHRPTALPLTAQPPIVANPTAPYADALKRAATITAPDTNIRTIVLKEMRKSTIESLEASSAERICAHELQEQEKRKSNVLVFGISEENSASDTLSSLLNTCAVPPTSTPPTITRLGIAQDNKSRPVRFTFSCTADAENIFSNLSALRGNADFAHISVRHDLTLHQSDIRNELLASAKNRSINGKVFRVVGRPNDWRIVPTRQTPVRPN